MKSGKMYWAKKKYTNGDEVTMFHYGKLGSKYLVIVPRIFRKDPIDYQYVVIPLSKIRSLAEDHILQEPDLLNLN